MLRRSILIVFCMLVLGPAFSAGAFDAGPQPELAGWWPLDDGQGSIAVDASGNGHDGIINGNPQWIVGMIDGALEFNGSDNYIDCGDGANFNFLNAITIACWIKVNQFTTDWQAICTSGDSSWRVHRSSSTNNIAWGTSGLDPTDLTGTTDVSTGDWFHVAGVFDGAQKLLYINGNLDASSDSPGTIGTSTYNVNIGENNQATGRYWNGSIDDVRIYSRGLTAEEVRIVMAGYAGNIAVAPDPEDGAIDIPRDAALSWSPSDLADTHDVYLGTAFDDVNNASRGDPMGVLVSQGQSGTTYDPEGLLEFGQTYYWRIDEVNAPPDSTVFKGEVWSFTAEPFAYPIANIVATSNGTSEPGVGPERTIDGSGLNELDQHSTEAADMWLGIPGAETLQLQYDFDRVYKMHELLVWNYNVQFEAMLGFGLKDVTVEYTADGQTWEVLGDVVFAQATARSDYEANTAVAFDGAPAQSVRLTVNSGYGPLGQFGLSELRFLYIPAHAREPQPADGASDVLVGTTLSWRAGREAVTHDVYLGTDAASLPLVDSVSVPAYTAGNLLFGTTYYWRIDEVNEADAITVWEGDLWTFDAQEFAVIDDMESYDDEENRIYDSWLDGFVNGTGSTVGYFEAPFAETTVVNSGRQSMPLEYDNSGAPFHSEAELDLGSLNLETNGADTLRLFVSGQAPAFNEAADGTILMNAIGTDIWGNADEFRYAYKSLTGNGSMVARVDDLGPSLDGWAKAGVMVRQNDAIGSRHSFMCMTGGSGNGASWQGRLTDNATSVNTDATSAVAPPYWVRIDRAGDNLTGYLSADGQNWTQLGDPRSITMTDPVLIGLALTSHNASLATSAAFSNVSFTGSVSGDWQVEEIGVAQPEGNIPESVYVAIEDTSGNVAVVTHPDAGLTARSGWTEWLIPYSDLAGANLSRAAIIYVGVGDRDNPTAGGTGLIFVDDIGYGHAAPAITVGPVGSAEITGDDGMVLSIDGIAVDDLVLGTTSTDFEKFADHPAVDADDFDLGTYGSLDDSSFINMVFSVPVSTIFIIERGANDLGFIQALDAAGDPVGAPVPYAKSDWFKPGVKINGNQDAGAIVIQAKNPIYGVTILPPTDANMGLDPACVCGIAAP